MKKDSKNVFYKVEDGIKYIIKPEERVVVGKFFDPKRYLVNMIYNSRASDYNIYSKLKDHKDFHDRPDVIVAVAKCDPRDEFDVELGMKIVKSKIDYKRHIRAAMDMRNMRDIIGRVLDNLVDNIDYHLDKADSIYNDYLEYFVEGDKNEEDD